ncbi:hypothetical protein [uncultured Oxalicibacterium sp.]|uniref:hypothetical protein n=1 Tax=uncultured Oxalicibacterium sp. TaxID=1168540 RepID=UPI0025FB4511|nr:hypothetical protein [uncultured Oxalicibacterium sp.]
MAAICLIKTDNKKADLRSAFLLRRNPNYFAGAAGVSAAGAAGASVAGAAGASAAGAAGVSAAGAGAAAGASAAGGVTTSTLGASSFLLQAVKAIANREAISRDLVMIYLSNKSMVNCNMQRFLRR